MIPIPTGFREEDGYRMAGDLLRGRRPDVIVAVNDSVAVGAYRALKERGLRVPRDVALAGFSDLDWTGLLAVPLTTVREPTAEIGRRAWALLMRRQRNPAESVLHERLAPVLVARASA